MSEINDRVLAGDSSDTTKAKWRDISSSWIGKLNIVKISVIPKLTYRLNVTPIKIPAGYFVDINKLTLK